jgi:hypothetical protein
VGNHQGLALSFRFCFAKGKVVAVFSMAMEVFGWFGGLTLIYAYAMVSLGKMSARGALFQSLNLVGGVLLAANAAWHHAWPSVGVNLIWIGIGVYALIRLWFFQDRTSPVLDSES